MTAPTDLVTESVETLAEALAKHTVEDYSEGEFDGDASLLCACGFVARGSDLYDAGIAHRAHVAAAVLASGAVRPAAEARAEVVAAVEAWLSTQVDSLGGQFHLVRVADLRAALAAAEPDAGERMDERP